MNWQIEIKHDGLNTHKLVKGSSEYDVELKAQEQMKIWNEKWQNKLAKIEKEKIIQNKITEAKERTSSARKRNLKIENFLINSLNLPPIVWEDGKDFSKFNEPQPEPDIIEFTKKKPNQNDFSPKISLFEKMNKNKVEIKKKLAEEGYRKALEEYNQKFSKFNSSVKKYKKELKKWKDNEKLFYENQKRDNLLIDNNKLDYENKKNSTVTELCKIVLSNFKYPGVFPKTFAIDFNSESKMLIVDSTLPSIKSIPALKSVKYIKLEDAFENSYISDSALKDLYDDLLYQLVLCSINELYKADYQKVIESIVLNGWVDTVDRGTGKDITSCIISIQTSREEFASLNLNKVNPKECFKKLKGVGSSKLYTITPIAPIIKMDKTDNRFVSSYEVIKDLDDSKNLALMDWEDFEHLIREIFEKEFTQNGGDVKVTQSSRDGGVDAIAFDPDPIRGGKIVIQAKRYTNVVGVAAVRDLYGTVLNEGATKGILVTTSNYGADAYSFAKGKPISLLNGSNLLHLLEKHGQKAKIDLKEARRILDENKK